MLDLTQQSVIALIIKSSSWSNEFSLLPYLLFVDCGGKMCGHLVAPALVEARSDLVGE